MFEPVSDNVALSQKIVERVTDAIVRGDLRPGDRLPPERELAGQFGVSRTAIRDAVKILSGRGVLMVRHGVGIFVSESRPQNTSALDTSIASTLFEPGFESACDLFDIRKTLETQAAGWAAERAEAHQLQRLRNIVEDAWRHRDDAAVLNQRDAQFHVAIAEASGNLLLVKLMWSLLDALEGVRQESLRIPQRPIASLSEHREILRAIADRDSQAAQAAMYRHLSSVEQSILAQHRDGHS